MNCDCERRRSNAHRAALCVAAWVERPLMPADPPEEAGFGMCVIVRAGKEVSTFNTRT